MKIINTHDIIKHKDLYDAICVTTNNVVKRNGQLVMGGGVAKYFAQQYPKLPYLLGQKVKTYGNQPFIIKMKGDTIVSFPTKNHYKDPSLLELIENSAKKLEKLTTKFRWTRVAIPAPGVGLGRLKWSDVQEILEPILDDRFVILFKGKQK